MTTTLKWVVKMRKMMITPRVLLMRRKKMRRRKKKRRWRRKVSTTMSLMISMTVKILNKVKTAVHLMKTAKKKKKRATTMARKIDCLSAPPSSKDRSIARVEVLVTVLALMVAWVPIEIMLCVVRIRWQVVMLISCAPCTVTTGQLGSERILLLPRSPPPASKARRLLKMMIPTVSCLRCLGAAVLGRGVGIWTLSTRNTCSITQ
mmetsp:Transcript_11832/g.23890  ORF Transcript_11832/g.23890 Transcript_11832/m.23890 type:complete len:205 (+) Transcript_11832:1265-1879(+)